MFFLLQSFSLFNLGDREFSPEEPKFISSPSDRTVIEGETITLQWKITGTPVPQVMW